ncbi:hypothetical protein FBY35_2092 [Streptomyces sp. SLBN-118]|uniref:DUF4190 domain-containing protein n=1 Tax=Streptomyces sp. SLBN-118 TaxID=2768454 RepID=UPI0011708977|nr:DUF4190 domain-containing protein [Streptomyces sp. SLBN-118]TQK51679.1 hypothetical protein FBY35_2092 [Streptomyces sp. SLBN-118]
MQLTAAARTARTARTESTHGGTALRETAGTTPGSTPDAKSAGRRDADGMAVAAFVLGLVGLLVMNIVLGPIAVVLSGIALRRGTARRGRALLGLALGVADLAVLAVLVTVNGTVVWGIGG